MLQEQILEKQAKIQKEKEEEKNEFLRTQHVYEVVKELENKNQTERLMNTCKTAKENQEKKSEYK